MEPNVFADDVVERPVVDFENPYAPPVDNRKGVYDWSLAKRIFYTFLAIAMVYASALSFAAYQEYRKTPRKPCMLETDNIRAFFTDWQDRTGQSLK